MLDWNKEIADVTAVAERTQAAEALAEGLFDQAHAEAAAAGDKTQAVKTDAFHGWMAARHATDAAWGAWAVTMDGKPGA